MIYVVKTKPSETLEGLGGCRAPRSFRLYGLTYAHPFGPGIERRVMVLPPAKAGRLVLASENACSNLNKAGPSTPSTFRIPIPCGITTPIL